MVAHHRNGGGAPSRARYFKGVRAGSQGIDPASVETFGIKVSIDGIVDTLNHCFVNIGFESGVESFNLCHQD